MDTNDLAVLRTVAELDTGATAEKITKRHGTGARSVLANLVELGMLRSYVLVVTIHYALTTEGAAALDAGL